MHTRTNDSIYEYFIVYLPISCHILPNIDRYEFYRKEYELTCLVVDRSYLVAHRILYQYTVSILFDEIS